MAVIIDGWDKLPQNCYDCDLQNYHECCLTCNSIEDYTNGEEREPSCPLKEVPTGKWISTKQLEDMYKKFERKLWNEREDVRGDDMVEIGFAEQFLQDGLMELGCWDDVVEEQ